MSETPYGERYELAMTLEEKAIAVGNDSEQLYKRLMDAKYCLQKHYRLMFSRNHFDFQNKRMLSNDRRFSLQWRVRLNPGQPESYKNQQTSSGCVCLVLRDPKEVSNESGNAS